MKKCFFGAIAVLALASCSNEKVVELSQDQEIKFTVETGKATSRAADGYCNNAKPTEFKVWASADSKSYFAGEVFSDVNKATYTPKDGVSRYWPASEKVNFFATKNENGTTAWTFATPSLGFTGFTVENTVADQKDFIYAAALDVAKPAFGASISLNFRHALSQIEFKAMNKNPKIYVEIDQVKVVNVKNTGDFLFNASTADNFVNHDNDDTADKKDGNDVNLSGRGTWSNQSGQATYETAILTSKSGENSLNYIAVPYNETTSTSLTVTDASGEYNTNTMYLLPQELTPWARTEGAAGAAKDQNGSYFIVKALIYNVAGGSYDKDNDIVVWGDKTSGTWATKEIAIPVPAGTWDDGKRYVYTFVFTTDGNGGYDPGDNTPVLTPITLEVTVDDFVDAGNKNVNME